MYRTYDSEFKQVPPVADFPIITFYSILNPVRSLPLSSNVDIKMFNITNLPSINSLRATNVQLTIYSARFSYACVTIAFQ